MKTHHLLSSFMNTSLPCCQADGEIVCVCVRACACMMCVHRQCKQLSVSAMPPSQLPSLAFLLPTIDLSLAL